MAFSSASLPSLFLLFLFLHLVAAGLQNTNPNLAASELRRSPMATIDCKSECNRRCRLSSRHNLCKRACGSCCVVCKCVPPGTWGNKEQCPCYDSLTTHGGRKKCP